MKQYLDLCNRVIDNGVWVKNARTGKRCLTVIKASLTYDVLPKLNINPDIKTLGDLETWVTLDDFELVGYTHQPKIVYPFTV